MASPWEKYKGVAGPWNKYTSPDVSPTTGPQITAQARESDATARQLQPQTFQGADAMYQAPDFSLNPIPGFKSQVQGVGDVVKGTYEMVRHPINAVTGELSRMGGEAQQAYQSATQGKGAEAVGHALAINPLEPPIESLMRTALEDPNRAIGQVLGGYILGKAGGEVYKKAAPVVKEGVERAVTETTNPALYKEKFVKPQQAQNLNTASQLLTQFSPPSKAAFDYRHPGEAASRAIIEEGINAKNTPDIKTLRSKMADRLNRKGQAIDNMLREHGTEDVIPAKQILSDLLKEKQRATASESVKASYQKALDDISGDVPDSPINAHRAWRQAQRIEKGIPSGKKFTAAGLDEPNQIAFKNEAALRLRQAAKTNVPSVNNLMDEYGGLKSYVDGLGSTYTKLQRQALPTATPNANIAKATGAIPGKTGMVARIIGKGVKENTAKAIVAQDQTAAMLKDFYKIVKGGVPERPSTPAPIPGQRQLLAMGGTRGPIAAPPIPITPDAPLNAPDVSQYNTTTASRKWSRPVQLNYTPRTVENPPAIIQGAPRPGTTFYARDLAELQRQGQAEATLPVQDYRRVRPKSSREVNPPRSTPTLQKVAQRGARPLNLPTPQQMPHGPSTPRQLPTPPNFTIGRSARAREVAPQTFLGSTGEAVPQTLVQIARNTSVGSIAGRSINLGTAIEQWKSQGIPIETIVQKASHFAPPNVNARALVRAWLKQGNLQMPPAASARVIERTAPYESLRQMLMRPR